MHISIIGEDNVYFYVPEMAMFMGQQGKEPTADPPEGDAVRSDSK